MLEHILEFDPESPDDFTPLKSATPAQVLNAQNTTASWAEEFGVPSDEEIDQRQQTEAARDAFKALNFDTDAEKQKTALISIKTPAAVQHLTGMLTAYDWEFVHQAKEIRGYAVAKIMEETKHPDARIRLKALDMLGKVTEVALFTDRVEITKKDATETEVEERLRERLAKFLLPHGKNAVEDAVFVPPPEDFSAGRA
jgi:hypothetical protein